MSVTKSIDHFLKLIGHPTLDTERINYNKIHFHQATAAAVAAAAAAAAAAATAAAATAYTLC